MKKDKWYKSSIRLSLVLVVFSWTFAYFLSLFIENAFQYIGVGLVYAGIWQSILNLTGHYK